MEPRRASEFGAEGDAISTGGQRTDMGHYHIYVGEIVCDGRGESGIPLTNMPVRIMSQIVSKGVTPVIEGKLVPVARVDGVPRLREERCAKAVPCEANGCLDSTAVEALG